MSLSAVTSEAVLFFSDNPKKPGVVKAMLYSDLEAILDGVVGIPEFSGKEMHAAFCGVDGRLRVLAVVLFKLSFDQNGMADPTWNLPLRHLAEHAEAGPDLGAGAIHLACKSQCPVAWHQEQLWDPSMSSEANDFVFIRDTIKEKGRKLGLYIDDSPEPATASAAAPVLTPQPAAVPPVIQPEPQPPVVGAESASAAALQEAEEERLRMARLLKELRLRVQTLENNKDDEIAHLRYAHQQKEEILSTQLEKVLMQFQALKSQNAAMKEQNNSLKAQVEQLNHSLEEQAKSHMQKGDEIEILTEQYRVALEQRLEEERGRLNEQLHAKEMEVLDRDEQIAELHQEIADIRKDQVKMANSGAEKLLEKLQTLGLNFIAFHPGAGHISINAHEISDYMQNPVAFAARKCLVTEEHYRAWLEHYENPVCTIKLPDGKQCDKRVLRVDTPNKFKPGVSDRNSNRCQYCRNDSAIENVLKFR